MVHVQERPGIAALGFVYLAPLALLLAGCGGATVDPEEFRRQMASSPFGSVERLDINRPLREVAATFRERAPACLKVTTKHYGGPAVRYTMQVMTYTPTVVATDNQVELHLHVRQEALIKLYEEGPNGVYAFLARATPLDARRTHLEIWAGALGGEALRSAVKGWASGSFVGCPDLS